MIKLDVFVVLYKQTIDQSETLAALRRLNLQALGFAANIYIWDNSPHAAPIDTQTLDEGWRYHNCRENLPLSRVYNTLLAQSYGHYVLILDQDSVVDTSFFLKLGYGISRSRADVYVPIIRHEQRMVSPAKLLWIKGVPLRRYAAWSLLPRNFTAMMSGLCITRDYLRRCGTHPFNERLTFYGVDTRFFRDLSHRGGSAYLHGAILRHDSVLRPPEGRLPDIERQIWLWQSWLHVFDRNHLEATAVRLYIFWKVGGAIRYYGPRLAWNILRAVFT
jgi:GT2 family glycosyltransferase